VKQQTENLVSIYTEDIKEFSSTITHDTKEAISDPEIINKVGLQTLFGTKNKMDTKEEKGVMVNRQQARILALENEIGTYCTESGDRDDFLIWKKEFNLQSKTDEISRILSEREKVRESHSKLVPVTVSYSDFWERYYYKLNKLQQEDERRAALVKRATNSAHSDEEQFSWDEEEETSGSIASKSEVQEYLNKFEDLEVSEEVKEKETEQEVEKEDNEKVPEVVSDVSERKSDEEWIVVKDQDVEQKKEEPVAEKAEDWDNWE